MDEIGRLDFSQIDLSEWVATLYEADMIPEASEEGLTGSGRTDNKYSRQTASERTKERTKDIDKNIEATKDHLKKPNIDCSIYPRPPVCEYGFSPEDNGGN